MLLTTHSGLNAYRRETGTVVGASGVDEKVRQLNAALASRKGHGKREARRDRPEKQIGRLRPLVGTERNLQRFINPEIEIAKRHITNPVALPDAVNCSLSVHPSKTRWRRVGVGTPTAQCDESFRLANEEGEPTNPRNPTARLLVMMVVMVMVMVMIMVMAGWPCEELGGKYVDLFVPEI